MNFIKEHLWLSLLIGLVLLVAVGSIWYKLYIVSIQETGYEIIEKNDVYEVRAYESYLVAQTEIETNDWRAGGNQAFRILAGYIFGGNTSQSSIAMTSPVLDEVTASEPIAMTSPVLDQVSANGSRLISFILPSKYTLETLPVPNDERVLLREVPAKKVAVIRFSGLWNQSRFEKKYEILKLALIQDNKAFSETYTRASYDPPIVPPFLRTNEIQIELVD